MTLYFCHRCKQNLPEEVFSKSSRNTKRGGVQSYCKPCALEYGRQHRKDNAESYRERSRQAAKTLESRLRTLLTANTVDRSNLEYDWCLQRIKENGCKCEITGIPFTFEPKDPTSLSIDRINPQVGYIPENVRFVCWWVNAAMGNWGLKKLKELIKEWEVNDC